MFNKGIRLILLTLIFSFFFTTTHAQNIMQINNAHGVINDTMIVSLAVTNDEEFISFQCDLILPEGFIYIPESISLSPRSVDHVVNVTDIGNNTIRILSYSLSNTAFLLDTGTVAQISLITPSESGDYIVDISNGIIGNAESVNILDSLIAGEINLSPIGVYENEIPEDKISCFPNPFNKDLTIKLDVDYYKTVDAKVFDIDAILLSYHKLDLSKGNIDFVFDTQQLLGKNPSHGIYFIHFSFQDKGQIYSIVKKVHFKK